MEYLIQDDLAFALHGAYEWPGLESLARYPVRKRSLILGDRISE